MHKDWKKSRDLIVCAILTVCVLLKFRLACRSNESRDGGLHLKYGVDCWAGCCEKKT